MLETDLYGPIEEYFAKLGFVVHAEVNGVDVVAQKEETILLIELKTAISMKLLFQGIERQKIFEDVYLAIPHPGKTKKNAKAFKEKVVVIQNLRLGLLLVDVLKNEVEVLLDPVYSVSRKQPKKKKRLLKELSQRERNHNIGGSTGMKIMTSYRIDAIKIKACLEHGPKTTKEIKAETGVIRATQILYDNYYGWFEHLDRGLYGLKKKKVK